MTSADIGLYIIACILFLLALYFIGSRIFYEFKTKPAQIKLAEARYKAALKSGDKADALQKGRLYYSWLRNGNLTIYDEQAIANDLSTMQ